MTLEFRARRQPTDISQLSAIDQAQLVIVGRSFDGENRSAESRLRDEPVERDEDDDDVDDDDDDDDEMDWDDGNLAAHNLLVYQAWENGQHIYDVWVHHSSDNGCVFLAGTTQKIAGRFQDTWMELDAMTKHPRDEELREAERRA